jgi:hypothetical protein
MDHEGDLGIQDLVVTRRFVELGVRRILFLRKHSPVPPVIGGKAVTTILTKRGPLRLRAAAAVADFSLLVTDSARIAGLGGGGNLSVAQVVPNRISCPAETA